MKKITITLIVAASTLLGVGQIDDALLNELDAMAQMQEEAGPGITPENAYYEATGGMGIGSQMEEAAQQVQQSTTQETVDTYEPPQLPQDTQQQQQQILLDNPTVG